MKLPQKSYWFVLAGIVLLAVMALILIKLKIKPQVYETEEIFPEDTGPRVEYFVDSTYKVEVLDTLICIYRVKTGARISTLPRPDEIRSMALHPSGSHLLILQKWEILVYDLKRDDLANTDTTGDWSENDLWLDLIDEDYIEFSADGKYLMVIDYGNDDIRMYQWPGLEYLDSGCMGYWHNCTWENKAGKFVFQYYFEGYKKYIYRFEFPADPLADTLLFSKEVCIDSLPIL